MLKFLFRTSRELREAEDIIKDLLYRNAGDLQGQQTARKRAKRFLYRK